MENKQYDKCTWDGKVFCLEMSRKLPFPKCIINSAFNKAQSLVINDIINREYNTDTSAGHPVKG